jgi:hypothetical protein
LSKSAYIACPRLLHDIMQIELDRTRSWLASMFFKICNYHLALITRWLNCVMLIDRLNYKVHSFKYINSFDSKMAAGSTVQLVRMMEALYIGGGKGGKGGEEGVDQGVGKGQGIGKGRG